MSNKEKDGSCLLMLASILIIPLIFIGLVLLNKRADAEVERMLSSDEPVEQLLLALESKNFFLRGKAEDALNEFGDPLLLALTPVCGMEAVQAAGYSENDAGTHPLVYMTPDGKALDWTYAFLEEWGPASRKVEDVQLVVCALEKSREVQTCRYDAGYERIRTQEEIKVEIHKASTGEIIYSEYLKGPEPDECPASLSSSNPNETSYISGGRPDKEDVRLILEGFFQSSPR